MDVAAFDFELPPELIAQEPPPSRTAARLLYMPRTAGPLLHTSVDALPGLLQPGDLLVVNNTRVFPARLMGQRLPGGGAVECLLIRRLREPGTRNAEPGTSYWEALMHPGQRLKPGSRVVFSGPPTIQGEVLEQQFHGRRVIRLWSEDPSSIDDVIDVIGHVPLPPYIKRAEERRDRERYQTVFAAHRGSIAAPTAGLHFSAELLAALARRNIERADITLHVGYGTFQPVRVDKVEDHRMESEEYEIGDAAADAVNRALAQRRRIIAVGTTTVRTLETAAQVGAGRVMAGRAETRLFIYPGFDFRVTSGLLTNFHLPKSSLLMLVAAFAGRDRTLEAYREAVERRYRFYSYGDAMLIL